MTAEIASCKVQESSDFCAGWLTTNLNIHCSAGGGFSFFFFFIFFFFFFFTFAGRSVLGANITQVN